MAHENREDILTTTMQGSLNQWAVELDQAAQQGQPIAQWAQPQALTLAQAYAVQSAVVARRCARGDAIVGLKQGFTNRAMMQRLGLTEPATGILCRSMQVPDGGVLDMTRLQLPRVEVEVMFRLARAVPPDATAEQARAAVEAVAVAIEIVDSRYRDFKFSVQDAVADNVSACGFVIGPWQEMPAELGQRAVTLEIDGKLAVSGNTANILDDPLLALCMAARLAARDGRAMPAGSMVLAGSAIDPLAIRPGQHVVARIEGMGTVQFRAGMA